MGAAATKSRAATIIPIAFFFMYFLLCCTSRPRQQLGSLQKSIFLPLSRMVYPMDFAGNGKGRTLFSYAVKENTGWAA
jgi:hypothetical protein